MFLFFRKSSANRQTNVKHYPWEAFGPPCGPMGVPGPVFRPSQVTPPPLVPFWDQVRALVFCRSLENVKKGGSLERSRVNVEQKHDLRTPSDPLGRAAACTPAQFSRLRRRPSGLPFWSNFRIKSEPEISTILLFPAKLGLILCPPPASD